MKTSEIDFHFPVLGFTADAEMWGFPDMDRLTKCGPQTLKENTQAGMELIDADLRRWGVTSIRRIGRAGSILSYLLIFGPPQSRIEQEVEPLPAISLADVQIRACRSMDLFSKEHYYGDDGQAEYRQTLADVRSTRSVTEIYDLLNPDTFEPY